MIAAYLVSCDPITFGHINIIDRASKLFSHVIVGIGENPSKKYVFTQEERVELAREALRKYPGVSIQGFQGLGVDFAYENGAQVIIRGVRNAQDFEYEYGLRAVYDSQKHGIETLLLFADSEFTSVSSSSVRALELAGGDITPFVPLAVKKALEKKLSRRVILGVTGDIAAGKSFFCEQMIERGVKAGLDIHNLDTDKIAHQILEDLDEPVYKQFREEIAQDFGIPFVNGVLDRRALSDTLFWYPSRMKEYNRRIRPLLLTRVRKEIAGLHGVVLLNSALLVEAGIMPVCNNQVIHIYNLDPDLQRERMRSRGLSEDQIDTRISVQTPRKERDSMINGIIAGSAFGSVHCVFDDLTTDKAFSIILEEGRTL